MTSVSRDARQRASDKLARLAGQGLDLVSLWRASTEVLTSVVPYDFAPCWFTLDPASLLVTSHFDEGVPELPDQWLLHEYYQDDVNKLADVARSRRGISTLHEATGGDPASSPRWHFNMTLGGDQELIAALRTPSGEVWEALGLYREPGRPLFDDTELAFVQSLAPSLAEGARRALLVGEATDPEGPNAPGLLVLSDDGEVESATPGVERWLAACPMATCKPASCRRRCWRWPVRPCARPSIPTSPARSRSPGCCRAWVPGSCSTALPWSPAAPAAWP